MTTRGIDGAESSWMGAQPDDEPRPDAWAIIEGTIGEGMDLIGPFTERQSLAYMKRYGGAERIKMVKPYDSLLALLDADADAATA